jgi:uncharacterized protein YjiK
LTTDRGGTTLTPARSNRRWVTTVGNIGLEGVSFDPSTRGYIFL